MTDAKSRKGFLSRNTFDREHFLHPEIEYAPMYSWMWDDVISEEKTERRLEEMRRLGIKRFYILPIPREFRGKRLPSAMSPAYLTKEYFAQCRYAVKRAAELGMQVWIYDEGGWPSGGACGRVLAESDDHAKESVKIKTYRLHVGEKYTPDEEVITAFVNGKRIQAGYVSKEEVSADEYRRDISVYQGTSEVCDVTKAGATDAFLRLTHEGYRASFGEEFGTTVTAVFTDEPTGPRPFPYREELSCKFYNLYSVHIEDHFPQLFGRAPIGKEDAEIIINWYDLCSAYFCHNFSEKERALTNAYGLTYLGHMDKDDETNGSLRGGSYHIMRALRTLDVPGVDVIHRQIYPDKARVEKEQGAPKDGKYRVDKVNHFFPRYASSAAAQIGARHALTESFAVYGDGLTFAEMRYVLNFQAIRGINVFNLMALSYGESGAFRAGILPHFSEKNACYADLPVFNKYCERLAYLASLGRRKADVALYYPIRDSYVGEGFPKVAAGYEAIGEKLEEFRIDFDVFDDDVITSASEKSLDDGVVKLGAAEYKTLVFPYCRYIAPSAKTKLSRFIAGGGTVLVVSAECGTAKIEGGRTVTLSDLGAYLRPSMDLVGEGFSISASELTDGELYLIMNENPDRASCTLRLPQGNISLIRDITESTIVSLPKGQENLSLTLESGELVCLLRTDAGLTSETLPEVVEDGEITDWTLRKLEKMIVGKERTETVPISEVKSCVRLGDWREYVGEDFSGSCLYETVFDRDPSRDCILDIGEVHESCRVEINGHSLGTKVMPPYRWRIPKEYLLPHNAISVRVTNTCANAFLHTDVFDEGASSYYDIEKKYLADSLAGGLFGKVKLYSVKN